MRDQGHNQKETYLKSSQAKENVKTVFVIPLFYSRETRGVEQLRRARACSSLQKLSVLEGLIELTLRLGNRGYLLVGLSNQVFNEGNLGKVRRKEKKH